MSYLSPKEFLERYAAGGAAKTQKGAGKLLALAVLAGAMIALGGLGQPQEKRLELIRRFRTENGAIDCAALLKAAHDRGEERKPHCDRVVRQCVEFVCRETGLE